MADLTPLPSAPTNADLAVAIVQTHACVEASRNEIAAVAREQARVKVQLAEEIEASRKHREQTALNQELLLDALRIERPAQPQPKGKSLATLTQAGAGLRILGVVATALVAAPLAAKIAGAIWLAVSAVLMK